MEWNVENYQFVYFHQPQIAEDAFQVWIKLFQVSPDNYQRHPDQNSRITQASGNFAGYTFQVVAAPGRIDVFVMGNEAVAGVQAPSLPSIKNDGPALDILVSKVKAYPCSHLGVVRLAFVTQLNRVCSSPKDATALVASVARPQGLPEETVDLTFSLNVRRKAAVSDFVLNRLCRWQAGEIQFVQVQVGALGNAMPTTTTFSVATFNIDVNTVPHVNTVKDADLITLIDEIVKESASIRAGGINALVA